MYGATNRAKTTLLCGAAIALVVTLTARASAEGPDDVNATDEAKLARGMAFFEAGDFPACSQAFAEALDPSGPTGIRGARVKETARIYYAACLMAAGQDSAADRQMAAAIRANPTMRVPDSVVFPKAVVERFIEVRSRLFDEIRRAERERLEAAQEAARQSERRASDERLRVARLEELATHEVVIDKNSRWLAIVPFGAGQFQNDDGALGWVFLTTESLLLGAALVSTGLELGLYSQVGGGAGLSKPQADEANSRLDVAYTARIVSTYSFLGVAALGILEAEIAFVPERREVRLRPLPEELRPQRQESTVTPRVSVVPGGAVAGFSARF